MTYCTSEGEVPSKYQGPRFISTVLTIVVLRPTHLVMLIAGLHPRTIGSQVNRIVSGWSKLAIQPSPAHSAIRVGKGKGAMAARPIGETQSGF